MVLWLAYRFFRGATKLSAKRLHCPKEFLTQSGLAREEREEFNFGLIYAEIWRAGGDARAQEDRTQRL